MLLPSNCPYAKCPPKRPGALPPPPIIEPEDCRDAGYTLMPWNGRDTIACCRARDGLWGPVSPDEPPLCRCPGEEAYRFEWRSSFDGTATVRISRQGEEIVVRWKYRWFAPERGPGSLRLTMRDWDRLTEALEAAAYWSLDPNENSGRIVLDGATWTIEGRCGHDFHVVQRRSGKTEEIEGLGRLFFDLAGPPLAGVRLY